MKPFTNITDRFLAHRANGSAARTAVSCGDRQWSYDELSDLVLRAGAVFRELGVIPGERILLLLPDGPEWVASFLGAARIGAIPVPLNTLLSPAEYETLLRHSRARWIVADAAHGATLDRLRQPGELSFQVLQVGRRGADPAGDWEARVRRASPEGTGFGAGADAPAFWLYSSGSTGTPKAAVHAHRSLAESCDLYARQTLGLRADDVCFSAAKLFHAYGLGNGLGFPLLIGAQAVYWPGPPMPETLFEVIDRHRPTVFFATPTLYNGMLAVAAEGRGRSLASVRLCVSAGEALPAATFERWRERFGLEIVDGIGSTEMVHIFISNRPGACRAGSTGHLVPGYRARVVDESGQEAAPGVMGDLWVGGPTAMLRYEGDPDRTGATLRGDWVVTGDKYLKDEEGRFWYQGRSDDMLKVNGLWVSPTVLENALCQHEAVDEAAVVGVRDADGLTQIKAFVVLRAGETGSESLVRQLQAFVRRLLPQRYPRHFEFIDALPKTATGKTRRAELRKREVNA